MSQPGAQKSLDPVKTRVALMVDQLWQRLPKPTSTVPWPFAPQRGPGTW